MSTVAGIFPSRAEAERAASDLRSNGIASKSINLLTPGTSEQEIERSVPTADSEQPGMGGALGGTVGGALGAAGGMGIGAAVASLFVPGVGPVLAAGILGAALLGAGGAAAGAAAGSAMEESIEGLPHDELFIYEDALRHGHSVVMVQADDDTQAEAARALLTRGGAESVDAARESWWVGLRDAEAAKYSATGADFAADEQSYRRGFEAAQHPFTRGKSYQDAAERLRKQHGEVCDTDAFRRGYTRGQNYYQGLREKHKS